MYEPLYDWFFWIGINITRWWFQTLFIFTPIWGHDPIWLIFFLRGWNHQLVDECMMNYKVTQWHGDSIFFHPPWWTASARVKKIWKICWKKTSSKFIVFRFQFFRFFSRNTESCSQNHGSEKNGIVFERYWYVLFEMHKIFHWTIRLCEENCLFFQNLPGILP